MGNSSRTKGKAGELELFGILREHLGDDDIQRNHDQTRAGGMDCAKLIGGMALEVKRWGKNASLAAAIDQATVQAIDANGVPCVAYRMDRGEWTFLPILNTEQFCQLVRERTCEDMT